MMTKLTITELAQQIGEANRSNNLEKLKQLRRCFQETEREPFLPLSARVALNPEEVEVPAAVAESDAVLPLANAWARAYRGAAYRLDKLKGVRRPVIVSEGDSWFQYPIRLKDVIDVLVEDHELQIYSLGAAGDLLSNIFAEQEYESAIDKEKADIFLISGGGNDMVGGGRLRDFILEKGEDATPEQRLDREAWQLFLDQVISLYRQMFRSLSDRFPQLQIICHGYDFVLPRGQKWLGESMDERGVPGAQQAKIVEILINDLNDRLIELSGEFERVHHVDCRGTVGASKNSWFDELHPTNAGFTRVADLFNTKIQQLWSGQTVSPAAAQELTVQPGPVPDAPSVVDTIDVGIPEAATIAEIQQANKNSPFRKMLQDNSVEISRPSLTQAVSRSMDSTPSTAQESVIADPFVTTARQLAEVDAPAIPARILNSRNVNSDAAVFAGGGVQADATRIDAAPQAIQAAAHSRRAMEMILTERVIPDSVLREDLSMLFRVDEGSVSDDVTADQSPTLPLALDNEDLLRRPPCESLIVWQAHVSQDKENLRAYEDFRTLQLEFHKQEDPERIRQRRFLLPIATLSPQERILGESDLFQINFLSRGVRCARAVGRISVFNEFGISLGSGTGFLIGGNLLLTNHHVLSDAVTARHSHVLFEYEYDEESVLKATEKFDITGDVFCTSETHDFTFVSVAATGSQGNPLAKYGRLPMIRESGKALKGEPVSIIQHADGLPKQIAIRNSRIIGRARQFIYYITDTNPGSSGSPVVNDQWLPVALHHRSVPHFFRKCEYISNRGIRISSIYDELELIRRSGDRNAAAVLSALEPERLERTSVSIGSTGLEDLERNVEPFHEVPYDNRNGYDEDFLGLKVPLPGIVDASSIAAPLLGTRANPQYELKYEHASIFMNRVRRLALFTAANVDYSPAMRTPDRERPSSDYTRRGLGDLGKNDREKWFLDPRLAAEFQLPDVFYNRDRKAFHKGHLVRRDAVAWGNSYRELKRANGDTFHVTNCSPQVANFNLPNSRTPDGIWGDLEKEVERQSKSERLCVFSGPVFSNQDRDFQGIDDNGDIVIPIPSVFWKLVVARSDSKLQAFAFWLPQNLSQVEFEFAVSADLRRFLISVGELERKLGTIVLPQEIHDADQS